MVSPRPSLVVRGAGRYEVLLVLLATVLVLSPFVSTVLEPVIVALLGGVLVYALWTSRAAIGVVWVAAGLAMACVLTSAVAPVWLGSVPGGLRPGQHHPQHRCHRVDRDAPDPATIGHLGDVGRRRCHLSPSGSDLRRHVHVPGPALRRRLLRPNGVAELRRLPLLQLHHPDHRRFRGPDRGHGPRPHARRGRGSDGPALPRHHRRLHRRDPTTPHIGRDDRTARAPTQRSEER